MNHRYVPSEHPDSSGQNSIRQRAARYYTFRLWSRLWTKLFAALRLQKASLTNKFTLVVLAGFLLQTVFLNAQDKRYQYPAVLSNSFAGVSIGYINYPFSNSQLESGFQAASVKVPHTAVRIILFGHEFNQYLSAQITYMRPVDWVEYKNINGD